MRPISQKNKRVISSDPFYQKCIRSHENNCDGRITIDHTIIYQGRQLDELWALVPCCEKHHAVNTYQDSGNLDREYHVYVALNRATDKELIKISKAINYLELKERLNKKYGLYDNKKNT